MLFSKFLEDAPSPIVVTGVVGNNEDGVVRLISSYGDVMSAQNWPGEAISGGNMTVLSAIRPEIKKIENQINIDNILATLGNKPVTTIFTSDGDALFYQANLGFRGFFGWENVQDQNFGWETNPMLSELAPIIWNYYQDTRSRISFTSGISGIGYVFPHLMNSDQFSAYLETGGPYLEETGLHVVRFNGIGGPWDADYAKEYYDKLKDKGYLGTIIGFQQELSYGISLEYNGVPAPAIKPAYTFQPANKNQVINELIARKPNESVIQFVKDIGIPEILDIMDDSASNKKAILITKEYYNSPSYSMAFYAGPISLPPGEYEISFRLKVPDNTPTGKIAKFTIVKGFSSPDYTSLGFYEVSPADFPEPNKYQEFTYAFTLDQLTNDVEIWMDYGDGSVDLYADNIRLVNTSGFNLPVFAPLYMSLAVDPSDFEGMSTLAGKFENEFQSKGGLLIIIGRKPRCYFGSSGSIG